MVTVLLACDKNDIPSDQKNQATVAKILENAGYTVEKLAVGPNNLQAKSKESSSKGKVGVYMVNGADIGTYKDFADGIGSYYNIKYCYFALQGWISPSTCSCEGAKTVKLSKAHDDNYSSVSYTANVSGKTTAEVMEMYKSKIAYACGSSPEELGKNLVKVMGGSTNDSNSSGSSASTIREALKKAVSGWDGEAEIRIIDDTVYVNKIKDPTTTKLVVNEFENVIYDSVSVTDANPQTTNKIILTYNGERLSLSDELAIKRFGENVLEIEPDEFVKNRNDAIAFLQRNWNKSRRDSGRQIELKVYGDLQWKTGLWTRVYLPRFFIDDYFYISRCTGDEDSTGNWTNSLTLVDYPPSFGTFEEEETTEEETEEDTEITDEEDTT